MAGTVAPVVLVAVPAHAQSPSVSRPVVQAVPDPGSRQLNAALVRLGRNPRDAEALLDAGRAALAMGDNDAAIGFFRRAGQVVPTDGRVKAGLAGAYVRNGDPFAAIPLFDEAEAGGITSADMLLDRGLAYDLVSDNARAQGYYRRAAELGTGQLADEATRRLALSLAMAGDRRGSEAAIAPLLARQDKASWRARAFALAILGQPEEAVAITRTTMPENLSTALAPYLRYMRSLTRAQQAAAANLGTFPRASEIGRDDPRLAAYAPAVRVAAADPRASASALQGRNARNSRNRREARSTVAAPRATVPPVAIAASGAVRPAPTGELPPIDQPPVTVTRPAAAAAPPVQVAARTPVAVQPRAASPVVATPVAPVPAPVALAAAAQPAPAVAASAVPAPAPAPTPAAAPAPVRRPRLADAFSEFVVTPARETSPPPGAVDIRRITPARDRAAIEAAQRAAAAKALPSHPSRIWVQVATGRDKAALAFDWRRMTRQNDTLFKGKRAFTTGWGQTNRLLTGPFESTAAANAFIAQLGRADIDGSFVWSSPAGQVVDAIVAAK